VLEVPCEQVAQVARLDLPTHLLGGAGDRRRCGAAVRVVGLATR
jgi:hypothetical protein